MKGILKVHEMLTKTEEKVLKTSKIVTQNQPPILIHRVQNLLTSILMIIEFANKHHCKFDKIQRKFVSIIICDFQLFLSITQVYVSFQY